MIDRERIRQELFQTHGLNVGMQDPLMVSLLINEALFRHYAEHVTQMVSGLEPTLEEVCERLSHASLNALSQVLATSTAKGATQLQQTLDQGIERFNQGTDRAHRQLHHITDQLREVRGEMIQMYRWIIYASFFSGGLSVGALGVVGAIMKGWL